MSFEVIVILCISAFVAFIAVTMLVSMARNIENNKKDARYQKIQKYVILAGVIVMALTITKIYFFIS